MVDQNIVSDNRKDKPRRPDFRMETSRFAAIQFLFECGYKLKCSAEILSVAATMMHSFWQSIQEEGYDSYFIAIGCLRLASKAQEKPLRNRDLVNVAHRTLNRGCCPLELGTPPYCLRTEALRNAELLIMRILEFHIPKPVHLVYLLHYLKSLREVITPNVWDNVPISQCAFGFIQDFHHSESILDFLPEVIAVGCIELALQCYGVKVPFAGDDEPWYFTVTKTADRDNVWRVMESIMDVYNQNPLK